MRRRFALALTGLGLLATVASIAHALEAGEFDPTFASDGVFIDPLGEGNRPGAAASVAALQPDGKIVVAGTASNSTNVVARLNPDGTLDPSFDADGKLLDPLGAGANEAMFPEAIAFQADGSIVVAGTVTNFTSQESRAAVVRLTPEGSFDDTLDDDGVLVTQLGVGASPDSNIFGLAVLPDGRILLAGSGTNASGSFVVLLARRNADGSPDPTFGTNGKKLIQLGEGANASSGAIDMRLQPDGKILIAGPATDTDDVQPDAVVLARFDADGQALDPSFGSGGKLLSRFETTDYQVQVSALALQQDGKPVVAGYAFDLEGDQYCLVARVDEAGDGVDPAFSGDGTFLQRFEAEALQSSLADLVIQPDGKIVSVGVGTGTDGTGVLVLRLTSDGELDESFADGGRALQNLGEVSSGFAAVELDPTGSVVATGSVLQNVDDNLDTHALVARIVTDLPPVASFTATPNPVEPAQPVMFDGNASDDPDGTIASYEWDFGDDASETGATASHSYASPGEYTATLTVRDDYGLTSTTTLAITVIPNDDDDDDPTDADDDEGGCGCRAGSGAGSAFCVALLLALALTDLARRRRSRA